MTLRGRMHLFYYLLLSLLILITLPIWIWRYITTPKYRGTVLRRLGWIPAAEQAPVRGGPRIWLHAVSVGEAMAARALASRITTTFPDCDLLVTTVTRTGQQVVRDKIPEARTHHFLTLDLPFCLNPLIAAIRPSLLVIMETELWPGLFRLLARRGIPICVVNGRISPRSFKRYHAIRWLTRRLLADGSLYLMQSPADAERLIAMGAPPERVQVTGNLKYDQALRPPDPALLQRLEARLSTPSQPVWIAASTHPGEEALLLAIHRTLLNHPLSPRLILVPRHPERSGEILDLIGQKGLTCQRFSQLTGQWDAPLLLVDEIGWLAGLYRLARLVYLGGSLVPRGGQNMLEPASCGVPVLFGPHVFNFRDIAAQLLQAGGAIQVATAPELESRVIGLLESPETCQRMGEAARAIIPANAGALERTLEAIGGLLPSPYPVRDMTGGEDDLPPSCTSERR
ncbi:MAG: 3-deoxy-D-manno-octulosonic acid transferase [Magnetococcales bacterium]|nr:3-deoxy-D-manno-octulosonic acid transferase [Magnetococcales bacterium]